MKKSGQISIQMSWVFVLVIGAAIFGFFLTIINNQQERATSEEAEDLIKNLDSVFTSLSLGKNFSVGFIHSVQTQEPFAGLFYQPIECALDRAIYETA